MASIVTRNGKRCTAVPKVANAVLSTSPATSTSSSSTSTSTSTSSSSSSSSTSTSTSTSTTSTSTSSSTSTSTSTTVDQAASQVPAPVNAGQQDPIVQPETPSTTTTSTPSPVATPIQNNPVVGPAPAATTSASTTTADTTTSETTPIDSTTTATPDQTSDTTQTSESQTDTALATTPSPSDPLGDSSTSTTLAGDAALIPTGASPSTSSPLESQTNGAGISSSEAAVTGNAITTQQTIAIAAGVIGGVVAISLMAFILWLWRKRRMQQRRSTMLTPLSPDATFRGDEKGPYLISRTSVGPTPFSEKLWAVAGTKYRRLRGRVNEIVARSSSPSPSVNLDRGTSQFGPPGSIHSRNNSSAGVAIGEAPSSKGRFVDWWGRLAEDGNFNWRLRHESKVIPAANDASAVPRSAAKGSGPKIGSQPDFLTLLNMDDKQLEREAAARRRSRSSVNGNPRRSVSVGGEQHFLGGLGLDFNMAADPFSDVNAISSNTAKATPLIVSAANNPFSDANAITAPPPTIVTNGGGGLTTYVQNIRRSRGRSVNEGLGVSRQPSTAGTYYRESGMSIDTVGTRRTKFRSDPFDLDRPDLLQSGNSSTAALAGGSSRASRVSRTSRASKSIAGLPNTPRQAHVRTESFASSKYSSGVSSLGQWSDPGPDVGPAAARSTPTPDSALGRREEDPRRRSGGSQGSVGKAL